MNNSTIYRSNKIVLITVFLMTVYCFCPAQSNSNEYIPVYVDEEGIMRWSENENEVRLFGVNYTVPFAHAYRVHQYLNIPHKEAIEKDVYHMARLGFDGFRVHVWDCEISDTLGNLIENEHLDLFDYQLKLMKERGIKIFLTPIAFWPNGYPEPPEKTPGFSTKYGKENCLTDPDAIKAQENYLFQFMNHENPYTGLKYKDDPDIIAIEISNEPHHQGSSKEVTDYINKLSASIKRTGCMKPVFYNTSHSIQLAEAYYQSDIQGGTFQWYPTNLVHGFELQGNFLTNVNSYDIPFSDLEEQKSKSRIVYEFDAADIGRSYIYPYMVKSFRESGMQFITHFAYDPIYMAYANTEYTTHYMNLAYTPQKAISLMIAGEVCRTVPVYKNYGIYPTDTIFGPFRVSYREDLSEMITGTKYFYSNNTTTKPLDAQSLEQIAGYGNSPILTYDGTGAYFLDKLEDGVWRLEVMPDAIWIRDPFERASLKKEVAVILWQNREMSIHLPDLGKSFGIRGVNIGNNLKTKTSNGTFNITPGTYILQSDKVSYRLNTEMKVRNIKIDEFAAPVPTIDKTYLIHKPDYISEVGKSYKVRAEVISVDKPEKVTLHYRGNRWRTLKIEMQNINGYFYLAEIPSEVIYEGFLEYYIVISEKGNKTTYPGTYNGSPDDWDFYNQEVYRVRIVNNNADVSLFNPEEDGKHVYGNTQFKIVPSAKPGEDVLQISALSIDEEFPERAVRFCFKNKILKRKERFIESDTLFIEAYTSEGDHCNLEVALVQEDGAAFAANLSLDKKPQTYAIPLSELKKIPLINLPNSYPTFLKRYFKGCESCSFDLNMTESIQFSIGKGSVNIKNEDVNTVAIGNVYLK